MDATQLERLKEFKAKLDTTGLVSQEAVLSIESFLGTQIITSKLPIERITKIESGVGVSAISKLAEETIAEGYRNSDVVPGGNITTKVTYDETVRNIMTVQSYLRELIKVLYKIKMIGKDTFDRFLNEKIIYSYIDNERNETTEIIDMTEDYSILNLFYYGNDFISAVANDIGLDSNRLIELLNMFATESDRKQYDLSILPLLSAIVNNQLGDIFYGRDFVFTKVTFRNFYAMFLNIDEVIDSITSLANTVDYDIRDSNNNNHTWTIYGDEASHKHLFQRYKVFKDFMEHKPSLFVLDFMSRFYKK